MGILDRMKEGVSIFNNVGEPFKEAGKALEQPKTSTEEDEGKKAAAEAKAAGDAARNEAIGRGKTQTVDDSIKVKQF